MFPSTIRLFIQALFLVFVVSLAYGQDRKITSQLNPGCANCTTEHTLVYVRADGSHDTIHQIWDFTRGVPTMIFAICSLNSTLGVSWDGTHPNKFWLSEIPRYSFAASINKLYEYDDLEDNGQIDLHCPQRAYSFRHISWQRNATILTEQEAMVLLHGQYRDDAWGTGIVEIKMDLLPFEDYAVDLPHLIHTANSTLVDISLVNLTTARTYNASRFALHFALVSTDDWHDTMHYTMRKNLDDEHTPGVFEIIEIKTPATFKDGDGGFIQFRPVAYTQRERGVTTSTNAHVSNFNRTSLPPRSTLRAFYADYDVTDLLVEDMFVSFGEAGDGFYKHHNYTSWSFTIGYGAPPAESFSLFVIMVISIGLGVPVVLALSGVLYVLARRCRQRRQDQPERLFEED